MKRTSPNNPNVLIGRTWLLLTLGTLICPFLRAINLGDTLQARWDEYNRENPHINLYVHLDKNIYAPEDTIWFKAYVLTPFVNEVLYVRLVDNHKDIVMTKQFPMYDIRAHGDMPLPADLPNGTYYLYAYTDRMISFNPGDVFVQPVTVNKISAHRLEVEASVVDDKRVKRGDNIEILTRVKGPDASLLKGMFSFWVGEERIKRGSFTTNNQGEATINLKYPQLDSSEMVRCEIVFSHEEEEAELILNLRHEGNIPNIKVYPEGGHFIDGLYGRAVFHVFDVYNNPLGVHLTLLEDQRAIAETQTNRWGMGDIAFSPRSDATYSVAVQENGTTITLPFPGTIEQSGMGIRLDAKQGQTTAVLTNKSTCDTATLVLRTMDKVLWSQTLALKPGDSSHVDLPVMNDARGILELAVFDSLAAPKAERLFLNKVDDAYNVRCNTTTSTSRGITSVTVNLNVVDAQNNPVAANLSVSMVEKSMLNKATYRSILDAYYWKDIPGYEPGWLEAPDAVVDNFFVRLDRGRHRWNHVLEYRPRGYVRLLDNTGGVRGQVSPVNGNALSIKQLTLESSTSMEKKGLVSIGELMSGGLQPVNDTRSGRITYTFKDWLEHIPLDSNGFFSIPPKTLLVQPYETKYIMPGMDFSTNYTLQLSDYAEEMDAFVRLGEALNIARPIGTFSNYVPPVVNRMDKVIQLKEVTVDSRRRYALSQEIGKKDDYVCREYNVFNCVNHRTGGHKPVPGMVYNRNNNSGLFLYNGVGKPYSPAPEGYAAGSVYYVALKGISLPGTFYQPPATDTAFFKLDTRSTIYWNPNVYIDQSGQSSITCNLSERTGVYTLIVQGLEVKTRRPIYGTFDVRF